MISLSRTRRHALLGLIGLSLLVGCTTYQAPQLPDDQVATIAIADDTTGYHLQFVTVDGAQLSALGGLNTFGRLGPLKLLSGRHAIQVDYKNFNGRTAGFLLTFEARAGQRYLVHQRSGEGSKVYCWITDDKGATVPLLKKDGET